MRWFENSLRLFLIGFLVMSGCQRSSRDTVVIGLSLNSLKDPFLLSLKESAERAAEEAGVTLLVTNSEANLAKQINAVEDLLQRGVAEILRSNEGG